MATGEVTQTAQLTLAMSLAIAEQTLFWFVIALMLTLGVVMMVVAAWVYRANDSEPEVLAPLEAMGTSKFRQADPESQQHLLDEARPAGAKKLDEVAAAGGQQRSSRSDDRRMATAAVPRSGARTAAPEQSTRDGGHDGPVDDDRQGDADAQSDSDRRSRRKPRRYLAGDRPARRRPGAERFDGLEDEPGDDDGTDDDRRGYADDGLDDDLGTAYAGDRSGGDDGSDDNSFEVQRDAAGRRSARDDRDDDHRDGDDRDDIDRDGDEGGIGSGTSVDEDEDRVHRRSRLPFRVSGAKPTRDDGSRTSDRDRLQEDDDYRDRNYDSDDDIDDVDLDEADLVSAQDGYSAYEPDDEYRSDRAGGAHSAALAGLEQIEASMDEADGDTWLDRAERESPERQFRRDRPDSSEGGNRWRRQPVSAEADELVDIGIGLDDEPVSGVDPRPTAPVADDYADEPYDDYPDADPYQDTGGYQDDRYRDDDEYHDDDIYPEEAMNDMDFEQDDFDDYAGRSDRPGAPADPFFEDDFDGEWNEPASPGRPRRRARRAAEIGAPAAAASNRRVPSAGMSSFDPDEMVERFRERAAAVRRRPLPPVAGEERQEFIQQAKIDYQDFAMIGDAQVSIEDGVLVLRVDLRG